MFSLRRLLPAAVVLGLGVAWHYFGRGTGISSLNKQVLVLYGQGKFEEAASRAKKARKGNAQTSQGLQRHSLEG